MKKLGRGSLVVSAGLVSALALVGSAAGTTRSHALRVRHVQGRIKALAMDGNRIAYGVEPGSTKNRVVVWNVRSGRTTKVSGAQTSRTGDSSTGSGLFGLAIAGTRVAWLANVGGNIEGDDYLFASSVNNPKERKVASVQRTGDACSGGPPQANPGCAGTWLLGLVGSGNVIALDTWTTVTLEEVTESATLDVLGATVKPVANGTPPFLAQAVDAGRVAVLRSSQNVALYSASGKLLLDVNPSNAQAVALTGHKLVVLTSTDTIQIYDTGTGSLLKTLSVHGKKPQNLDAQGNIAIYTTASSVHAVNLSSGKARVVGTLKRGVGFAHITAAGVAYSSEPNRSKGTVVFAPMARVTAALR